MKIKTTILSTMLVALFAMSSVTFAVEKSCDRDGGGGGMGDNTRERGDPSSRGGGELNRDNDTQGAETTSSAQHAREGSHAVGSLGRGEPTDPGYSFNVSKQEMSGHD